MRNLKSILLLSGIIAAFGITGCSDDEGGTNPPVNNGTAAELVGSTGAVDRTLSADTVYTLKGFYLVQPGTKLIIPAGTVIQGTSGAAIITVRGTSSLASGQIVANGTADKPIVCTSSKAEGARARGDWGGIVLSGLADVNVSGGLAAGEGGTGAYGYGGVLSAAKNNDTSGTLRYVRVEYGGTKITADNEINGFTFNAVGNGTTLEYLQAHYIADDGFEWFGGTVNGKYLVSSGNDDDCFDMDFGYSGKLQFLFAIQDPDLANRGFEIDNDGSGSDNQPYTSATVANVTLVGTGKDKASSEDNDGLYLRRNNRLNIYNAIVTNFRYALVINGQNTGQNALDGNLFVKNSILNGRTAAYTNVSSAADYTSSYNTWNNKSMDPNLASITFESPNPTPNADVTMPSVPTDGGFFANAPYAGAFAPNGSNNWITNWTNFKKN